MVILILTACPAGLRGHLTRWMLELSPGVFVGRISARVRDEMWARVEELAKDGRALLVYTKRGEQGLAFRVLRHDWEPVDFDGITLMRRPTGGTSTSSMRPGWSTAARLRHARRSR